MLIGIHVRVSVIKDAKDSKDDKSSSFSPTAGGPADRTALGPSAAQLQQRQQPASGPAPQSPSSGAPPAGAKGAPAAVPGKGEGKGAGAAGFGTVPMFGPAQLDFGNGAAALSPSPLASKGSLALAFAFGIAWMVL
ncbi:hypothetical protein BGW39_006720 [Mortierella sp. 14UC]|nr:hypothetical protein BGW39_006720 [Mortierella sp. 14UC]